MEKRKLKMGMNGKFEKFLTNQAEYDILFNKEGEGRIIYSNGDIYEGNWVNFRKNGEGKEKTNGIIIVQNGDIFISE